jgi:hypothetical protein
MLKPPALEVLELQDLPSGTLTESVLCALLETLPLSMKRLKLCGLDLVSDSSLVAISKFSKLAELSLARSSGWSESALSALIHRLPELRVFDITGCVEVSCLPIDYFRFKFVS